MVKYIIPSLAICLCSTLSLFAKEEERDTLRKVELNTVVVTANKTMINRNSVPLSLSVIEREDIETSSGSALLPVLSHRVPGLFVTQKGITGFGVSEGAAGIINIRGVGQGNKVLMLLDGQPQWAGIFGHSLPDTYVSSDIHRIEIIRGPGSLIYGSNAMGGVVNVITKRGDTQGRNTNIGLEYGSYNTQKYTISNGFSMGRFNSFFSINHDRTDGHRDNSEFNITNGFAKIGYKISKSVKFSYDINLAKFYSQNPGKENSPLLDNKMDIFRGSSSLAVENSHAKNSGAIKLFYSWGNHSINDGYLIGTTPKDYLFKSFDKNFGALLYQTFNLIKGNTFTIGVDFKRWGGHAWNQKFSGQNIELVDKTVDETAAYIIAQQSISRVININAGLRYEYNTTFSQELIPQVGLTYTGIKYSTFKGTISKGFRSPNIKEMYMFPPKNPLLEPEKMVNYELSAGRTFLKGNLTAEITMFFINGKDMISIVMVNGLPKNINTGSFINKGLEFEAGYRLSDNMRFDFNYSYLNTSKPLLAAPKHKMFAEYRYSPGRFFINVNMQYVSGLYINTNTLNKENFFTLNSKVSYRIGKEKTAVKLFLKGDNLTGSSYYINEGYSMPGRVIMSGLNFSF